MPGRLEKFGYIIRNDEFGDIPLAPEVVLCLANWTSSEVCSAQISQRLVSEDEIDQYINALKQDLDAVGKLAKRALKRAKTKNAAAR